MENLVFGWVSPQIQGNYAAWSNWKKYGDEDVARAFYNETCEEAAGQGLTWFCLQDEQYE